MRTEIKYFLDVIKYILNDKSDTVPIPSSEVDWKVLASFARKHSILHMLYYGIKDLPEEHKPDEVFCTKLDQNTLYSIAIGVNQEEAAKEIEHIFEQENLYLLAVKGICTREHYSAPELRTMGDIDLLYKASQTKKMREVMKSLGYGDGEEGRKHDSFFRQPCISIEMHRELLSTDSKYYSYYEGIWERAQLKEGYKYVYRLSLEDEFIYNLLHLVEHFQNGGVGIRFVIDVYVYNHLEQMNKDYVEAELQKLELLGFYKKISQLAELWFGDKKQQKEENELLKHMANFILSNGTFGTSQNAAASAVAKEGRLKFLLKTVFPDLEEMVTMFPWLEKHPILLPYSWGLRIVRSIIFRRNNIKVQIRKFRQGDANYGNKLKEFYKDCGL